MAAFGIFAAAASAETINVTTTIDEFGSGSRCSLREAIWSANNDSNTMAVGCRAGSGTDTIAVEAGRFGIDLTAPSFPNTAEDAGLYGDLDVTAPATIVHTGIRPATIVSEIPGERVFQILTSVTPGVTLEGLTITGGSAPTGAEDHGGGILNGGLLTVRNSLIDENTAIYGAGVSTEGTSTATLVNTTISGNSANEDGGGLSVETGGTMSLVNDTIAGNTADSDNSGGGDGGGLFASTSDSGGVLNLRERLVAGNTDRGGEANDCAKNGGAINSLKHNLIGDTNGCSFTTATGDVTNRAPRIFGLADNGGPTETRSLNKISPAIDAGSSCPTTDQRGVPRNLGGRCDIGAYELARCEGIAINRIGTGRPGPAARHERPRRDPRARRQRHDPLRQRK